MKCIHCNKETSNPKFCSRSCAQSHNNKLNPKRLRKTKCSKCNNITKSYKHSLCEEHWKQYTNNKRENIENKTLLEYWNYKSLANLHASSKNSHIRLLARYWFKHLTVKPCAKCNYNKHVELCHIKSISSFPETATIAEVNNEKNLIQLCPNCHWEFDNHLFKL